jgi:hypothetical protein
MDVAAGYAEGGVMRADGLFVRAFQQAVNLAVRVVVQLELAHAELIGRALPTGDAYLATVDPAGLSV